MAIKRLEAIYKFLQAARNLVKNKAMKKDDILRFAKQEFGEVSDFLRKQIDNLFKKGTPSESKIGEFFGFKNYPKTAQKKKGEVIPFNKQGGIVRRPEEFATRKEYEKYLDETLGPPDDVFGSPLKDDLLKEWDKVNAKNVTPDIKKVIDEKEGDDFIDFVRKSGDEEGANKIQKEVDRLNTKIDEANKRVEIDEGIKSTQEYKDIVEELRNSEIGNTYAGEDLEKAALDMLKARNKLKGTLEAEQTLKKRTDDIASGDPEGVTSELMLGVDKKMKEIMKAAEELKKTTSDPKNIMDEILKSQKVMAEGYKKGNIRTAVRWFMRQEADAGKLKLSKDDYDALQVYAQTSEGDPINIFRRYYGEDSLQQIDEIGDVFRQGESFNHYAQLLRENVHPSVLTPKTKNIGKYDPDVLTPQQEDELRRQLLKDQEQKQMLEDFDPTDRTKNADGGLINILKL